MRMHGIIASLVFSGFTTVYSFAAGPAAEPRSKLASYDWSVSSSRNLATNPPSQNLVESFVRSLEISSSGYSAIGGEGGGYVCSFLFADLRHDGFLSLIYGLGVTDRPSSMDVEIVDKTS